MRPAFSLSVDSMVKVVDGESRSTTFLLQGSGQKRSVEAECFVVQMDIEGKETLTLCNEDYVIYPPIFSLAENQTRAIRVSHVNEKLQEREVALRIFFGELPAQQTGVQILTRMGCWLFFQPKHIKMNVQAHIQDGILYIDNQSNIHLRPISGKIVTSSDHIDISSTLRATPRILSNNQRVLHFNNDIQQQIKQAMHIEEVIIILENSRFLHLPMPE